jgi:hypothetical protein
MKKFIVSLVITLGIFTNQAMADDYSSIKEYRTVLSSITNTIKMPEKTNCYDTLVSKGWLFEMLDGTGNVIRNMLVQLAFDSNFSYKNDLIFRQGHDSLDDYIVKGKQPTFVKGENTAFCLSGLPIGAGVIGTGPGFIVVVPTSAIDDAEIRVRKALNQNKNSAEAVRVQDLDKMNQVLDNL